MYYPYPALHEMVNNENIVPSKNLVKQSTVIRLKNIQINLMPSIRQILPNAHVPGNKKYNYTKKTTKSRTLNLFYDNVDDDQFKWATIHVDNNTQNRIQTSIFGDF